MFQIDEEYLKELGFGELSKEEKLRELNNVYGAIIEKLLKKIAPNIPNFGELINEVKGELKQEITDLRALDKKNPEKFSE